MRNIYLCPHKQLSGKGSCLEYHKNKSYKKMMMKKLLITLGLILSFAVISIAQILEPVKWSYDQKQIDDQTYELTFSATIEKTWHLYSQDVPENGPEATSFYFYEIDGIEFIGDNVKITEEESYEFENNMDYIVSFTEPEGHSENDPMFDNQVIKYFETEASFSRQIKVTTTDPLEISGYIYFMCCDDSKCLPPNDENEFIFYFNGAKASAQVEATSEKGGTGMFETLDLGSDGPKKTTEIIRDKSVLDKAGVDEFANKSMWQLFIFSILAGLAAILTPCVFPMIPMTVSFFMKEGGEKAAGKMQAIVFGFSIVAIYTIVGTVIALTLGVNFANWLSTHWIPNVLFFLIFVFFAASFFGMFEITLPSWLINKSDSKADKGGFTGAFFMAFTLVLVSFSCTGPLVGAILVKAAAGEWIEPIVGMLGFSVAFALTVCYICLFPIYDEQTSKIRWLVKFSKSSFRFY